MDAISRRRRQKGDKCNCLRPLIRFWGITTAIVVCGVGVDIMVHGYPAGIYILISSGFIFFLEIKWILTLFIQLLCASGDYTTSNCVKCWSICKIFGGWRLSPLYISLGVALIMWPHNLWLSYVAGSQLIILAVLRLFTIFRYNSVGKDEGLLPQYDDSLEKSEAIDDELPDADRNLDDEEAIDDDI